MCVVVWASSVACTAPLSPGASQSSPGSSTWRRRGRRERERESRVGEREEGREGVKWYITTSDVPGLIIVLSCYLVLAFNLDCFVWNDTFSC